MKVKVFFPLYLVIISILLVLLTAPNNCVEGQATINCKYNEYITVDILGNQSCVQCPKCAVGYGLIPECGSSIKYGNTFECKPCINGINYSTSKDIGSCHPCGICTDHQTVINKCNKTHNSKCGKSCEKGFYYSPVTFDCQECSWCCGGSDANPVKDCKVNGVPFYKRCSVDDSIRCQPRCTEKQFVFVDKTLKKICINCLSCGIGKGLSPKCSSVITSESEAKCMTCDSGKTFSDVQDASSCKPCTKCDIGKKIERVCNITHNTLCGDCKHGFYADELNNKKICKTCSFCCGDKLDVRVPECKAQGMSTNKQCAYTEHAAKCNPLARNNYYKIALGTGIVAFTVLCAAGVAFYCYCFRTRNKYGQLVESSSETMIEHSSDNRQVREPPSRGSTASMLKFHQSGVKVKCEVPEVGQELLEKMSAEVSWDNYDFPKLKERQVFLSPVIKLYPQGLQVQQPLMLNLPHSAHYDNENQHWSIAVHKFNNVYDDSSSAEWTDLSHLKNIEIEQGGVEFSDNELGTYVVVGTPGDDQLCKKRMFCGVFGIKEPRVGRPYSINMYLFDDCEPSFAKIRDEEELQGRHLMASLRLLYPDVDPNSVINITIENVSDGWLVDYKPNKFNCEVWADSYRRNLKVEAMFKHTDTNKQDFRCLFKVKINDTTAIEVPVINYFEDYMSEPDVIGVQVTDMNQSDVTPVLESSFGSSTPSITVPLTNLTNEEITELSQSFDAGSVTSFARILIPDINDSDIALICASSKPFICMIDMAKRRNPLVTREELNAVLEQGVGSSQGAEEDLSPHLRDNGHLLV